MELQYWTSLPEDPNLKTEDVGHRAGVHLRVAALSPSASPVCELQS